MLDGRRSPEAPRRQQQRGYSDRTSERSRDLVGARHVLARQRGMKNWVCDGLVIFLGAANGLLRARGRRISRCGCPGGLVSREWWISHVKQSTARLKFAWLASDSGNMPRRVGQTPRIKSHEDQTRSQKISCWIRFLSFLFRNHLFAW